MVDLVVESYIKSFGTFFSTLCVWMDMAYFAAGRV